MEPITIADNLAAFAALSDDELVERVKCRERQEAQPARITPSCAAARTTNMRPHLFFGDTLVRERQEVWASAP